MAEHGTKTQMCEKWNFIIGDLAPQPIRWKTPGVVTQNLFSNPWPASRFLVLAARPLQTEYRTLICLSSTLNPCGTRGVA